ncbi:MAG: alpha/beta hydrolase family protein [Spirochaetota bacterium]
MKKNTRNSVYRLSVGILVLIALMSCGTTETNERTQEASMNTRALAELAGTWQGTLSAGGQSILLVFHIDEVDGGDVQVTMDSPDQGATGIPIPEASLEGNTLTLGAPVMSAQYQGTVNDAQDRIDGVWKQGGAEVDLVLERTGEAASRGEAASESRAQAQPQPSRPTARPQEPTAPFPYESTNVTFENEREGFTLAGTITYPSGNGPFPGVVLISGSGQQDRNEEVFGHKPFLVIADALTRSGFAVLRYDDRGVGESGGRETLADATSEDFAHDALAAYRYLARQPFVDSGRIGLLGHSEGGVIAPMVAAELRAGTDTNLDTDTLVPPAFHILMGAPGVPGDELLIMQSKALLRAQGASQSQIDAAEQVNRQIYDLLLSDAPGDEIRGEIMTALTDAGLSERQVELQLGALLSPWYRSFLRYDPATALRQIEAPVLAIIGELDRQVPPEDNLPAIRAALEAAPTETFTVRELEGLNHLLQPAQTGGVEEYSQIETTVAPEALDLMSEWALSQFR